MPVDFEPIITKISHHLECLTHGREAIDFARQNPEFVSQVIDEYDQLIDLLPRLTEGELSIMPYTRHFFTKLGLENTLPSLETMVTDPQWTSQCLYAQLDLRRMMKKAEVNKNHPESFPDQETIYFGTLTQSPQAYIVGVAGHTIERAIVNTLPPKDNQDWTKDDFLHAVNELVMAAQA